MKHMYTKLPLFSIILLSGIVLAGCTGGKKDTIKIYNPTEKEVQDFEKHKKEAHEGGETYITLEELQKYDKGVLSAQEELDIIHMRQEEKMARDIYRTLGETYAINQFKNIPMSEQKHTDAMELLLERYDIEDPITDETRVGTYKDEKFVILFTELTTQGEKSLIDALRSGAIVEDINMAKLLEVIENTDNEDIKFVYESVLAQSHHHMNAFIRSLEKEGETYIPTHITQGYFDEVIAGDKKGNKKGNKGKGKGQRGRK